MVKWVFIYICATFACRGGVPAVPGDGAYYDTRAACYAAARADLKKNRPVGFGRAREALCIQRDAPQ